MHRIPERDIRSMILFYRLCDMNGGQPQRLADISKALSLSTASVSRLLSKYSKIGLSLKTPEGFCPGSNKDKYLDRWLNGGVGHQ